MKKLIAKADILLESLPYFQKFRRKTFVIKLGGSAMEDSGVVAAVLKDVVLLEQVGINVIVVHGGGKAISAELKRRNIPVVFKGGLRVTDKAAIKVVEEVLVNRVNKMLVRKINEQGGMALGFSAADNGVIEVKKEYFVETDPATGRKKRHDLGYVGRVTLVRTHPIYRLLHAEKIPVIAPLGLGPDGLVYNINADTAACEIAGRLKAEKLIFLTDVDGIYDRDKKLVSSLTVPQIEKMVAAGVITGGMIPKSSSMIRALKRGVGKTHIINGMVPHSLLLEIYTDTGIGTELVKNKT
jgi:acetylglutamate kinase